ncbi:MAG: MogA/MoaB family molybdenum cofactor biosynthesis protein [Thermomicrobiales bacterium]|nr:MogA/MoaB family molybdenum cofactor biosynthesis protein [Thermomicrobiales bacterium]
MTDKQQHIAPQSVEEHRGAARASLSVAVLTVSDTRTPETDTGGQLIRQLLEGAGHLVADAAIVPDDENAIAGHVSSWAADNAIDAVILTGGTGLAARDRSVEALAPLLDRTIDGFGELFRMLSYEEIGAAAMLSRAFAGVVGSTPVFALPGSRNAISLAMEKLILPELGHVVFEVKK